MSNAEFIESVEQVQPGSEANGAAKIFTLSTQFSPTRSSTSGSWDAAQPGNGSGTLWQYANAPARNCMSATDFWSALSEATYRMNGLDAAADTDGGY